MNEYVFSDIQEGMSVQFSRKITAEMENSFRTISGDINPLHQDDAYAQGASTGKFRSHVCFGMLTASLLSTLAGVYLPGKHSLIHSIEEIKFLNPVYVMDTLTVTGTVIEKNSNLHRIVLRVRIANEQNVYVLKAKMNILVLQ